MKSKDQKISVTMSIKPLLVLSLAVNVALFLRLMHDDGGLRFCGFPSLNGNGCQEALVGKLSVNDAQIDQRTRLQKRTPPSPASMGAVETEDRGGSVINVDHGDPTMYEKYWEQMGEQTTIVISGWQAISYFSDIRNLCWFMEPEFADAVTNLHRLVGNAVTENRHIVVGTGSTQLFQAVLYALSPANVSEPLSVISAAPFYSSYPLITDFLKSGLYKWDGDAKTFSKDKPYIELVTSPNNPDGHSRQPVVNGKEGILVHDLAYYWPQYTPIADPADHDIMLFTVSKSTGHAGIRIGWALVKDQEIAKRMTKFMEISTIGVSKDSQLRAAKILQAVADTYEHSGGNPKGCEPFFDYGYNQMSKRWSQLRAAAKKGKLFSLPDFPAGTCSFSGRTFEPQPAFAWLKCEGEIQDCESFFRRHNILTRGGKHFGASSKYVRISMLDRDHRFAKFIERLSIINSSEDSCQE